MLPEIGHFAFIIATVLALLGGVVPVVGMINKDPYLIRYAWLLSYGAFSGMGLSLVCLALSFAVDDFSVHYIAQHSNTQLPFFFKLAAVWGGHEGSFLFWVFSLSGWSASVAWCSRRQKREFMARVIVCLSVLTVLFALFVLLASNPFERVFPAPVQGRDLNPMLQDIGLILHPPMLYLGYVGFAVSFAFAIAALTEGSGSKDGAVNWAKWARPWTLIAWVCLTAGIALGSWWAYYELGWGGWWFWDPVENASLMPWLTGTALLHVLFITHHRKALAGWSVLLAIFTFSLSVLGTFIVRSGVLTSVHAFAVDPGRGIALLLILAVIILTGLALFAFRIDRYLVPVRFGWLSKETMVLIGGSLFCVATLTVMLGTFYPMVFKALGMGNISVGAPYFNAMFVPMSFILFMFMGFALLISWQESRVESLIARSLAPVSISLVLGVALSVLFERGVNLTVCLAFSTAIWIVLTSLQAMYLHFLRYQEKVKKGGEPQRGWWMSSGGMILAHTGVAVAVVGAALVSHYDQEVSGKMAPGDHINLAGYSIHYRATQLLIGPNYTAEQADIELETPNREVYLVTPQRRHYTERTMNMSEPGIAAFWHGDIYITLGEKLSPTSYAIRIQYKPYVRWLWLGAVLMMVGGMLAVAAMLLAKRQRKMAANVGCLSKSSNTIVMWK